MEESINGNENGMPSRRQRFLTEQTSESYEMDLKSFQEKIEQKARPSNLKAEIERKVNHDDSILGEVHLALASYHEICRFTNDGTYDHQAALFHLKAATGMSYQFAQKLSLKVITFEHFSIN